MVNRVPPLISLNSLTFPEIRGSGLSVAMSVTLSSRVPTTVREKVVVVVVVVVVVWVWDGG